MKHSDIKEDKALLKKMVKKEAIKPGLKKGGAVSMGSNKGGGTKSRGAGAALRGFDYKIS